jgi:NADH dehydrogenase FAD-containing subunit
MSEEATSDGARVVIAGGGVAGIEALLALHDLAGDRASLTLVAPQPDFLYKPLPCCVPRPPCRPARSSSFRA